MILSHARAKAMRAQRLTPARARVLAWYADHPGATYREAADALAIAAHGAWSHVQALRKLELVESEDYRARGVVLTAKGWAALGRAPRCPTCGAERSSPPI